MPGERQIENKQKRETDGNSLGPAWEQYFTEVISPPEDFFQGLHDIHRRKTITQAKLMEENPLSVLVS
jgi:hypothetical protein